MSHRENITDELQSRLDEYSAEYIYELYTVYNDREPLIEAIRSGNPHVLKIEGIRELIIDALRDAKRGQARPHSISKATRDMSVLRDLHYSDGLGIVMYGTLCDDSKKTACEIVASRYHLSESTVRDLWKKNKNIENPLYSAAYKAGLAARG